MTSSGHLTPSDPTGQVATWQTSPGPRVPIGRFGKDHWDTLCYVETRWVNDHGMLDPDQIRTASTAHPLLLGIGRRAQVAGVHDGTSCPTRLKTSQPDQDGRYGTEDLADHDDWSCIDDLLTAGLITVTMPQVDWEHDLFVTAAGRPVFFPPGEPIRPSVLTGADEQRLMAFASFTLTERGQRIAGELRAHKAAGRGADQFQPS